MMRPLRKCRRLTFLPPGIAQKKTPKSNDLEARFPCGFVWSGATAKAGFLSLQRYSIEVRGQAVKGRTCVILGMAVYNVDPVRTPGVLCVQLLALRQMAEEWQRVQPVGRSEPGRNRRNRSRRRRPIRDRVRS